MHQRLHFVLDHLFSQSDYKTTKYLNGQVAFCYYVEQNNIFNVKETGVMVLPPSAIAEQVRMDNEQQSSVAHHD